jgi:hypothetical protein
MLLPFQKQITRMDGTQTSREPIILTLPRRIPNLGKKEKEKKKRKKS